MVVRESGVLTLGGRKMDVSLAPDGPTAGDVWLYDPVSRIAAVGDLVTLPVPFLDTACVAGWKSALARCGRRRSKRWFRARKADDPGGVRSVPQRVRKLRRLLQFKPGHRPSCAAGWVKDAGALLEANGMDPKRAQGMAAYYVSAGVAAQRRQQQILQDAGLTTRDAPGPLRCCDRE